MRRTATLLSTVLMTVVLAAAPARAGAPEAFTDHVEESNTIDCSVFDPGWQFHDDFLDILDFRGQVYRDRSGEVTRVLIHVQHRSNDVNSVTGFTLHEHNKYLVTLDFRAGTISFSGAINVMQRRGVGSVIRNAGHKVFGLDSDEVLQLSGPDIADDVDFCRAVAPVGSRP